MFLAVVAPTDLDLYAGLYGATMHQRIAVVLWHEICRVDAMVLGIIVGNVS
jgi:hypothetical protein